MHAPLLYTDFKKLSRKNLKNSLRSPGFSLMIRPDRLSCVYSPVQNMSTVASAKRVPFSSVTTERRMEMVFPLRIISPFAVTTDDMTGEDEGCFGDGALIFIDILTDEEKQALEAGDVVTFRWEGSFVTYRIRSVERDEETGLITSVTAMGDNVSSDVSEPVPVPVEDVVGIYKGGIEGLGAFAMFLQTPVGVLVFVGIPVVAYVIYDILRVTLHNRRVRAEEKEELAGEKEELARLKALVDGHAPSEAAVEEPAPEALLEEELPAEAFPPEDGGAL